MRRRSAFYSWRSLIYRSNRTVGLIRPVTNIGISQLQYPFTHHCGQKAGLQLFSIAIHKRRQLRSCQPAPFAELPNNALELSRRQLLVLSGGIGQGQQALNFGRQPSQPVQLGGALGEVRLQMKEVIAELGESSATR